MSDLNVMTGSEAQRRAVTTMVRAVGGRTVMLRMPAGAVAGVDAEQLGLATPGFQDLVLGPVVWRKADTASAAGVETRELLVSADAVMALVGSLGYGSAAVLFADAYGVLVDGALLAIESADSAEMFGVTYLYRVKLRVAKAQSV